MTWAPILLYVAGALACLGVGGGVLYALVQLGLTLKTVRQRVLPQVAVTLTTVQKNLDQVELVTRDLDRTIAGAHQLVETVNDATQAATTAVGNGLTTVQHKALAPMSRQAGVWASAAKGAWRHWKQARAERKALRAEAPLEGLDVESEPARAL